MRSYVRNMQEFISQNCDYNFTRNTLITNLIKNTRRAQNRITSTANSYTSIGGTRHSRRWPYIYTTSRLFNCDCVTQVQISTPRVQAESTNCLANYKLNTRAGLIRKSSASLLLWSNYTLRATCWNILSCSSSRRIMHAAEREEAPECAAGGGGWVLFARCRELGQKLQLSAAWFAREQLHAEWAYGISAAWSRGAK